MNFMYLIVLALGLLNGTVVKSESMFDLDHKVGLCRSPLISMIYHICKYYHYTLDNINSQEKNIEKETILKMCCDHTCLVKDIVQFCQDETRKRVKKAIANRPVATNTLGLKTNGKMNMASTVKSMQLGQQKVDNDLPKPLDIEQPKVDTDLSKPMVIEQQKVDTDLPKPLHIEPKDLSGAFLNIKFNILNEKYTEKFDKLH